MTGLIILMRGSHIVVDTECLTQCSDGCLIKLLINLFFRSEGSLKMQLLTLSVCLRVRQIVEISKQICLYTCPSYWSPLLSVCRPIPSRRLLPSGQLNLKSISDDLDILYKFKLIWSKKHMGVTKQLVSWIVKSSTFC